MSSSSSDSESSIGLLPQEYSKDEISYDLPEPKPYEFTRLKTASLTDSKLYQGQIYSPPVLPGFQPGRLSSGPFPAVRMDQMINPRLNDPTETNKPLIPRLDTNPFASKDHKTNPYMPVNKVDAHNSNLLLRDNQGFSANYSSPKIIIEDARDAIELDKISIASKRSRSPFPGIIGPGSEKYPNPPIATNSVSATRPITNKDLEKLNIDDFLKFSLSSFNYQTSCCTKLNSKGQLSQIKNQNLNGERLEILLKRLESIRTKINRPNIIDLCILIHCLKKSTYESNRLRNENKIEELYAVIDQTSAFFIDNLDTMTKASMRLTNHIQSLKHIIFILSEVVLKAIESPTGSEILKENFTNCLLEFRSNPDKFCRD